MTITVYSSTLNELGALRKESGAKLFWPAPFILPSWMQVWWQSFGAGNDMFIRTYKDNDTVIGVAPLMKKGDTASFLGGTDVCDYQDCIVAPGKEADFTGALFDDMQKNGISVLDLKHVRPDSLVMQTIKQMASEKGFDFTADKEDVSFEMPLPDNFETYLDSLNSKQRHEVRRKLRRLYEEGNIQYRFIGSGPELSAALETFFRMFVESRQDKAEFLTDYMKQYFRAIVKAMADDGILRLGILELDGKPVAEILCFEYQGCLYLYNSGYDPQYVGLSAGVLSKVLAIKYCIDKGIKKFDFLKGAEPYKAHIGGQEISLFHCRIRIK
jgi:CelD/BcsL family acetyltransferase involved in cellulose biosynthesis